MAISWQDIQDNPDDYDAVRSEIDLVRLRDNAETAGFNPLTVLRAGAAAGFQTSFSRKQPVFGAGSFGGGGYGVPASGGGETSYSVAYYDQPAHYDYYEDGDDDPRFAGASFRPKTTINGVPLTRGFAGSTGAEKQTAGAKSARATSPSGVASDKLAKSLGYNSLSEQLGKPFNVVQNDEVTALRYLGIDFLPSPGNSDAAEWEQLLGEDFGGIIGGIANAPVHIGYNLRRAVDASPIGDALNNWLGGGWTSPPKAPEPYKGPERKATGIYQQPPNHSSNGFW